MTLRARLRRQTLIIGLAALALVLVSHWVGAFEVLELKAIDAAFNLRGTTLPQSPIVIVAIDDESFAQTGQRWPWPRAYFARLVDRLTQGKPSVIAIDVSFYEPAAGDALLGEAIQRAGNVVLANGITVVEDPAYRLEQLKQPVSLLAANAAAIGLANFPRDVDGFVRRVLAYQSFEKQVYYHWALSSVALHLKEPLSAPPSPNFLRLGARTVLLHNQSLLLNYRGPARTFKMIPAYQVVNGDVSPALFENKIVLIGATTESLHDTYPTPFQGDTAPMAGVEIGANAIETILTDSYLTNARAGEAFVVVLIVGLMGLALNFARRPIVALAFLASLALLYLLLWLTAFRAVRIEIPLIAPEAALLLAFAAPSVERAASAEAEKRRVRHLFEQFVSPQMVDQLVERRVSASSGRRVELTILFSDIRGFTAMSEQMSPDQVVSILNEYLKAMTEIIFKYGGTLDKFEGDAILAFWGAPTPDEHHARNALLAALEMRRAVERLRQRWAGTAALQSFEIGIGLNTGDVFVGLIGSSRRVSYTVIGDHVNLAARLQDLTKEYKWPLLISDHTYQIVKDEFDAEFVAPRTMRGKTYPVRVYRVIGKKGVPEAERVRPLIE